MIKRIDEQLQGVDINERRLLDAINADKTDHIKRATSEKRSKELVRQELREWRAREVRRVLDELDPADSDERLFSEEERGKRLECPAKPVEKNLAAHFDAAYRRVRQKAVDQQWQQFSETVYPTEEEFDRTPHQTLRARLVERLARTAQEPVFEENVTALGDMKIDPVLAEAARQRQAQRKKVQQSTGADKIVPGEIGEAVLEELKSHLKEPWTKKAEHVYGIFPSVRDEISRQARTIAARKFVSGITDMPMDVTRKQIKVYLERDLEDHASRQKSWELVKKAYRAHCETSVLERYSKRAGEEQAAQFRVFLTKLLGSDSEVVAALDSLIARTLRAPFDKAREEVAAEQLEAHFKPLAEGTWKPAEKLIDSFFSATAVSVEKPLTLEGISTGGLQPSVRELFEETVKLVREREAVQIEEGLTALRSQMRLVQELTDRLKPWLERLRIVPSLSEVVERLTQWVKQEWVRQRHARRYPQLFARVEREIETRAKAMLQRETQHRRELEEQRRHKREEERKQQEAAVMSKKTPRGGSAGDDRGGSGGDRRAIAPPGGSSADGSRRSNAGGSGQPGIGGPRGPFQGAPFLPEPKQPVPPPDMTLDFRWKDGMVVIKVSEPAGQEIVVSLQECRRPNEMVRRHPRLKEDFRSWIASHRKQRPKGELTLHVLARVRDGAVSYGAIVGVRRCLGAALAELEDESIKVYWLDGYFEDNQEPVLPPDYRERSRPLFCALFSDSGMPSRSCLVQR